MNFSRTHSAILRALWLIEPNYVLAHLPMIAKMLNGESVDFSNYAGEYTAGDQGSREGKPICLTIGADAGVIKASRWHSFKDAPDGSIALIPVVGPVLKYGGECGEPGSVHVTEWSNQIKGASNIAGVIYKFDTPGGQVDGTATVADSIKNIGKPTRAFVDDGMMCSAGVWMGSAADKIYASHGLNTIGSIGVYTTLADWRGHFEKLGIKLHEIYAPQSTEKNKDYRDAMKGNYDGVKADLEAICAEFIKVVQTNRAGKIDTAHPTLFKGATFHAKDAVEIGLIDGIQSLSDTIAELTRETLGNSADKNSTQISTHMFGNKFKAVSALVGVAAASLTEAQLAAANANLTEEGLEGVTLVATEAITAAENQISDLTKKVKNANDQVATLQKQLETAQARIAELGGEDGADRTSVDAAKDKHQRADENQGREITEAERRAKEMKEINAFDPTKATI